MRHIVDWECQLPSDVQRTILIYFENNKIFNDSSERNEN